MKSILIHADGDNGVHAVAAELRVLVAPGTDGGFVAQGLDIDYVATGSTEDEARHHFAEGFVATIRSILNRGRSLDALFKSQTPVEARRAYFAKAEGPVFRCVLTEHVQGQNLPAGIPSALVFQRSATAIPA